MGSLDKSMPAVLQTTEDEAINLRAVEWVLSHCEGGNCPIDGAQMKLIDNGDELQSLRNHLLAKHKNWCLVAYAQQNMEPDLRHDPILVPPDPMELAGIKSIDQLDRYNMLYIPKEVRDQARKEGSALLWAAPDKVRRYVDMGAKLVVNPDAMDTGPTQRSTEDTRLKANEMTLVKFPAVMAVRRRQQKDAQVEQGLNARAEDVRTVQDSTEKAVYDGLLRQGKDRTVAAQVARAVVGRARRDPAGGDWRHRSPKAHEGVTITDQKGKRDLA